MRVAFANATHIFHKNISVYAILMIKVFKDLLTNDIVSFEQLGPDIQGSLHSKAVKVSDCKIQGLPVWIAAWSNFCSVSLVFCWFKMGSCQLLANICARLEDFYEACPVKV